VTSRKGQPGTGSQEGAARRGSQKGHIGGGSLEGHARGSSMEGQPGFALAAGRGRGRRGAELEHPRLYRELGEKHPRKEKQGFKETNSRTYYKL
jgi:hypothetical protein